MQPINEAVTAIWANAEDGRISEMIPAPSPPTDNLYKFLAIGGLLLLITGIVYPRVVWEKLEGDRQAFYKETAEVKTLLTKLNIAMEHAPKYTAPDGTEYWDTREFYRVIHDINQETPKIRAAGQKVSAGLESYSFWRAASYAGAAAGGVMTTIGFWFWATRLQRLKDRLLKYEVERAAVDVKKPIGKIEICRD